MTSSISHRPSCLFALFCTLLCLLAACDREDAERCQDIDRVIQAKGDQLPKLCNVDNDCVVVDSFLPENPAASNATPAQNDPELDELRVRRLEICGPFDPASTTFQAICNEGACEAVPTGIAPTPDVGGDVSNPDSGDTDLCSCATTADCSGFDVCVDGCTCEPLCADACTRVDACGLLETLGLGSNVTNCVQRCGVALQALGRDAIACIPSAECEDIAACIE